MQFGFLKGRSICDAIKAARDFADKAINDDGYCIAVSLDIRNAFNSLKWSAIMCALRRLDCPDWMYTIIDSYLSDRALYFYRGDGRRITRMVERGVPQGSVLGPFLWLLTYDEVLKVDLPVGSRVIGFADDTWVMCRGPRLRVLRDRAELACDNLISQMEYLGLEVSEAKTEVLVFGGRGQASITLRIGDQQVTNAASIRYLGLLIDPRWKFDAHLNWVPQKAEKIMGALRGLMPNLRGPREIRRRLYATAVRSVLLYGAPVWAIEGVVNATKRMRPLVRVQRRLDQRTICAYRTVSGVAAGLIARSPPIDILAQNRRWVYDRLKSIERGSHGRGHRATPLTPQIRARVKVEGHYRVMEAWKDRITRSGELDPGIRARSLLLPFWDRWMDRLYGETDFHLTQIIAGHGCFNAFLARIGRLYSSQCAHCGADVDDVTHTLLECSEWTNYRIELEMAIGESPISSEENIVRCILTSANKWKVVATIIGNLMRDKESAERARQGIRSRRRARARSRVT